VTSRHGQLNGVSFAADQSAKRGIGTTGRSQLHCATVQDGPNCEWSGGEYERIEAKNRAVLKEVEEFIEPEWREVMSPDGVRCFVTRCREVIRRVDGVPSDWRPCAPRNPILDDLSIPDFLKRF
jgi:hypothetical protein